MTPTLPTSREPLRVMPGGCIKTSSGVLIGCAYQRPAPVISRDGERIQEALLDKRTEKPLSLPARLAGAVWGWL